MDILKRLSLVVHWLGFLCTAFLMPQVLIALIFTAMALGRDEVPLIFGIFLWPIITLMDLTQIFWIPWTIIFLWPISWLIRFIITGSKIWFPWRVGK
jgi:hypothetical protein